MDSNHRPSGYEPDELPLLHAALWWRWCVDLVSQGVISPVPSALRRFTTRFGMGRGGSSALKIHQCHLGSSPSPYVATIASFVLAACSAVPARALASSALPATAQSSLTRQALGPQ